MLAMLAYNVRQKNATDRLWIKRVRHDLGERRWHQKTTESQGLAKSKERM
jgi:hypothetical protein